MERVRENVKRRESRQEEKEETKERGERKEREVKAEKNRRLLSRRRRWGSGWRE